jgi:hypothetical protein
MPRVGVIYDVERERERERRDEMIFAVSPSLHPLPFFSHATKIHLE